MDPNDPQVKFRQNQILHTAALRLQRIFRGYLARKQITRMRYRQVARNYGHRAPLRTAIAGASPRLAAGGEYLQRWEIKSSPGMRDKMAGASAPSRRLE